MYVCTYVIIVLWYILSPSNLEKNEFGYLTSYVIQMTVA